MSEIRDRVSRLLKEELVRDPESQKFQRELTRETRRKQREQRYQQLRKERAQKRILAREMRPGWLKLMVKLVDTSLILILSVGCLAVVAFFTMPLWEPFLNELLPNSVIVQGKETPYNFYAGAMVDRRQDVQEKGFSTLGRKANYEGIQLHYWSEQGLCTSTASWDKVVSSQEGILPPYHMVVDTEGVVNLLADFGAATTQNSEFFHIAVVGNFNTGCGKTASLEQLAGIVEGIRWAVAKGAPLEVSGVSLGNLENRLSDIRFWATSPLPVFVIKYWDGNDVLFYAHPDVWQAVTKAEAYVKEKYPERDPNPLLSISVAFSESPKYNRDKTRSPSGAKGTWQFMPGTWNSHKKFIPDPNPDPNNDSHAAIAAAIKLDSQGLPAATTQSDFECRFTGCKDGMVAWNEHDRQATFVWWCWQTLEDLVAKSEQFTASSSSGMKYTVRVRTTVTDIVNLVGRYSGKGLFWGFSHNPLKAMTENGAAFNVPTPWQPQGHSGRDFRAKTGTPIQAVAGGVVVLAKWTYNIPASGLGHGNTVIIYHGDDADGEGRYSIYAHCSKFVVSEGQVVKGGEIIAYSGGTGAGSNPHLHFAVAKGSIKLEPDNDGIYRPFTKSQWIDPKPLLPWGGGKCQEGFDCSVFNDN